MDLVKLLFYYVKCKYVVGDMVLMVIMFMLLKIGCLYNIRFYNVYNNMIFVFWFLLVVNVYKFILCEFFCRYLFFFYCFIICSCVDKLGMVVFLLFLSMRYEIL